ncbi:DNA/RNA helicase domain-containing protein [Allokutzneria albata]|uniref:Schlafen group 3-like DNA/RNA helicase domain-containing protein n=1 Tax=Allokutzneria albata TaxID=211114 RepID=A0A1H0B4Q2_ALLAB|nr:DNA/RNA helicase domain-containing protein [Allokutzneria albata]SDN40631.1 hypothetical protein SAMN04489726_6473 [Allokutzneria albata]
MTLRVSPRELVCGPRDVREGVFALARELDTAGLGEVGMLVEYRLPHAASHADVVLAGVDPETAQPSYVVVEIKSWRRYAADPDEPELVKSSDLRRLLDPVVQADQYAAYLANLTASLRGSDNAVIGMAYLPDARREDVPPSDRLFTGSDAAELRTFLRSRLAVGPSTAAVDQLLTSATRPLRPLLSLPLNKTDEFVLLDQQMAARLAIRHAAELARVSGAQKIIIGVGPSGSGKSTLGLTVLTELCRSDYTVMHATASASFTSSLRKTAGSRSSKLQRLFTYFNAFTGAPPSAVDVLICDEAHRIRESSVNRYTPRAHRTGRSQIDELINAAKVTVFLLDEEQAVRPGEIGTLALIEAAAAQQGIPVRRFELGGQFRAGGNVMYPDWVSRLLELDERGNGPVKWTGEPEFVVKIADTPTELEERLVSEVEAGHTARIVAGMCWPWSDAHPGQPLVDDIVIGDWRKPWSAKGARGVNGLPSAHTWAVDPKGFGQVGMIYNVQGFEFDWVGVIIGPDLVWRGDHWVANRLANRDSSLRRISDEAFSAYIRRTYRVLLTRGRSGVVLYSADPETRDKLCSLVPPSASEIPSNLGA